MISCTVRFHKSSTRQHAVMHSTQHAVMHSTQHAVLHSTLQQQAIVSRNFKHIFHNCFPVYWKQNAVSEVSLPVKTFIMCLPNLAA